MSPKIRAALLALWAAAGLQLALVSAHAQTLAVKPQTAVGTRAQGDPADPKAPVPMAPYVSPLRVYQGFSEPPLAPWRETNELVRQRGGWRAYAREAREPDAAPTAAPAASGPAAAAKPSSGGHSGHEMK